ncbi:zinc-binding protein A33-like [Protopterus annectens]|uniref:zinc-binding protein A33-like n=1 Tax=Protopterus annectens TaxID=7888 RepID=UPI001CFB8D92|nr:zinc-binding protein A33-like [Protopterus annectens]
MASHEQTASFIKHLICPVCNNVFKSPVTLECGHNCCRTCIDKVWEKKGTTSCPECREELPERRYVSNHGLTEMAEAFQKSGLEKEGKTNVELKEEKFFCEVHEEKLKLFCIEDETLICVICRDSAAHGGHSFLPLKEAVTLYKEKLKTATDALELKRKHITELQLKQEGKISYIQFNQVAFDGMRLRSPTGTL